MPITKRTKTEVACPAQAILRALHMKPLKPGKDGLGRCHEISGKIMLRLEDSTGWRLVNGFVRCSPTQWVNHTWIEYRGWVVDWGDGTEWYVPVEEYYRRARAIVRKRFTRRQACEVIGNTGRWDFEERQIVRLAS
jgi:hypothetical protein